MAIHNRFLELCSDSEKSVVPSNVGLCVTEGDLQVWVPLADCPTIALPTAPTNSVRVGLNDVGLAVLSEIVESTLSEGRPVT